MGDYGLVWKGIERRLQVTQWMWKFFCGQGWQVDNFFSGALFSLVLVGVVFGRWRRVDIAAAKTDVHQKC